MTEKYLRDDRTSDREEFQVAVTVFATAKGVDYRDAAHGVEFAVKHALAQAGTYDHGTFHVEVPGRESMFAPNHCYLAIDVHDVMEAGMAAGNGYLWLVPTIKAFPRKDDDDA